MLHLIMVLKTKTQANVHYPFYEMSLTTYFIGVWLMVTVITKLPQLKGRIVLFCKHVFNPRYFCKCP